MHAARLRLALGAAIALLAVGATAAIAATADNHPQLRWVADAPQSESGGAPASGAYGVQVDFSGEFLGWALLDRSSGAVSGQNLTDTSSTESMVKTWIVADFLRRATATGDVPSSYHLELAGEAIRWSDDNAAQELYLANGADSSITRMIEMCGLTDTALYEGWWSRTEMSPRDAVRLGECLADGTAAGPEWTDWLLSEMRQVTGSTANDDQEATRAGGRWGIIDGVSAATAGQLAIKNGWTHIYAGDNWHLNCLAISDDWVMSVMMRYPASLGLDYGADRCESVARQLTS